MRLLEIARGAGPPGDRSVSRVETARLREASADYTQARMASNDSRAMSGGEIAVTVLPEAKAGIG